MDLLDALKKRGEERKKMQYEKQKNKLEFSKILLIQESVLIWVVTLGVLGLAYLCIINQYFSELPWLTALVGLPWTAYGISQGFYYKKSERENCEGIIYQTAMAEIEANKINQNEAVG